MARDLGYLVGEATALQVLGIAAFFSGDTDGAIELARQQQRLAGLPGWIARGHSHGLIMALIEAGDLAGAASACAAALGGCRDSGELLSLPSLLMLMADLDLQAGRVRDAAAHLREGLQAAIRAGDWFDVAGNGLWYCAMLCAATGRPADAVTMWAALDVRTRPQGGSGAGSPGDARRREEAQGTARQALGPDRVRAAEERGAAMSLDTAAEYALMLTAPAPPEPAAAAGPGLGRLSPRERELVILVAQDRTNAQIAAQLSVSVRTVSSHLDRIRTRPAAAAAPT